MALTPEQQILGVTPEVSDLSRQKKIAELLMSQGLDQPQGQMISGYYVAPSWSQQLNPLFKAVVGTESAKNADRKELELAAALRGQKGEALTKFQQLMANPETRGQAMQFAANNQFLQPLAAKLAEGMKLSEGERFVMPGMDGQSVEIAAGAPKYRAPLHFDVGNAIELRDPNDPTKVIARMPKSQMPTAGQVVETANGPMLVNTRTGQATPVMGAGGQAIAPKLTPEQSKDITSISQQIATIDGALKAVQETPSAFSFKRGAAQDLPGGETLAGRLDTPEEAAARAYVFNNVSAVVKERAGTAQSAQELQRLNTFMPGPKDSAQQIINKFTGFKTYLKDLEKGTRANPNLPIQTQTSTSPQGQQAPQIDPKLLQYMTPEQQALFKPKG